MNIYVKCKRKQGKRLNNYTKKADKKRKVLLRNLGSNYVYQFYEEEVL